MALHPRPASLVHTAAWCALSRLQAAGVLMRCPSNVSPRFVHVEAAGALVAALGGAPGAVDSDVDGGWGCSVVPWRAATGEVVWATFTRLLRVVVAAAVSHAGCSLVREPRTRARAASRRR